VQLLLRTQRLRHPRDGRTGALEALQHPLGHLFHVGLAFAQVGVFHLVELASDDFELTGQGPFGVVEALFNPVAHTRRQLLIQQQHEVHIQQGTQLVRRILGHVFLQALEFFHHLVTGTAQATDFSLDLPGFDEVMRHIHPAGGDQHGAPDRDAACDRQTVDAEGHLFTLAKFVRHQREDGVQCFLIALAAGFQRHFAAQPGANIITPMMLWH